MKRLALAALAAVLLAPCLARAELPRKMGSFELGLGMYRPNIDSEFSSPGPYQEVFGGRNAPIYRLHVAGAVYDGAGTVEVGFKTGFFTRSGHAVTTTDGASTSDKSTFRFIPTSLTLTYRADNLYEDLGCPLVPYVRVALERYNWWVTKDDSTSKRGATNGWSASAGLVLMLDFLDPEATREMSADAGLQHFAAYGEIMKSKVDDFGSKKSWDLSEDKSFQWSAGLLFVF